METRNLAIDESVRQNAGTTFWEAIIACLFAVTGLLTLKRMLYVACFTVTKAIRDGKNSKVD